MLKHDYTGWRFAPYENVVEADEAREVIILYNLVSRVVEEVFTFTFVDYVEIIIRSALE